MADLKEIIAKNLTELRKKNNLTQNELAEKLNYSDNTVSRWEHAEITPSVETLVEIAKIYDIPVELILKENAVQEGQKVNKLERVKKIAILLMLACQVWFVAAVAYFYADTVFDVNAWIVFVWSIPVCCLVVLIFTVMWKARITNFVMTTILIWTLITATYLQFLQYNIYLIFILGLPLQASLTIWTFVRRKRS